MDSRCIKKYVDQIIGLVVKGIKTWWQSPSFTNIKLFLIVNKIRKLIKRMKRECGKRI